MKNNNDLCCDSLGKTMKKVFKILNQKNIDVGDYNFIVNDTSKVV